MKHKIVDKRLGLEISYATYSLLSTIILWFKFAGFFMRT